MPECMKGKAATEKPSQLPFCNETGFPCLTEFERQNDDTNQLDLSSPSIPSGVTSSRLHKKSEQIS